MRIGREHGFVIPDAKGDPGSRDENAHPLLHPPHPEERRSRVSKEGPASTGTASPFETA
ncbi:hypothetical protein [Microvirga flavescens]|uniref:hypothetical protein n=1 Tax=Microvirga flavescens TaxID=2249811 RepID=UPI001300B293|nr:hypothetical protein [Microvirga flavescens]